MTFRLRRRRDCRRTLAVLFFLLLFVFLSLQFFFLFRLLPRFLLGLESNALLLRLHPVEQVLSVRRAFLFERIEGLESRNNQLAAQTSTLD